MTHLIHGGALDAFVAEYGARREHWLDLSTGINPVSFPVPDIDRRYFARLPDQMDLRNTIRAARTAYGVEDGKEVVAVAGTQSAIQFLPRMFPGDSAAILSGPFGTYGEHAYCCAKAGRKIREYREPGEIGRGESLAVLVHPNNPDGMVWKRNSIHQLALRLAGGGGNLIVDEAFCDNMPAESFVRGQPENMIILRSFGKFFGLAGIRLGFAICAPDIAERIRDRLGPWPVSGPALAIAASALSDQGWIERARKWQRRQSKTLGGLLQKHDLEIVGRHPLFVLVRDERAGEIAIGLARCQIAVRRFPDRPQLLRFGLPGDGAALARLDRALTEALEPVPS